VKGLEINHIELFIWETEQERKFAQKFSEKNHRTKDPKKEKRYEYNRKQLRKQHFWKKEDNWVKKITRKKFRRDWKLERKRGKWHRPVNREYRTYGRLTW